MCSGWTGHFSGKAYGEVYEDDGLTVAHKEGAYVHRAFTFADGVLTSTARRWDPAGTQVDAPTASLKGPPPYNTVTTNNHKHNYIQLLYYVYVCK
jgi:hypothetical protein